MPDLLKGDGLAQRDMTDYRTLLDSIDQGYCLAQIMTGTDDRPCDYRFLEVNTAFVEHSGLTDPVGHTALELVPDMERQWIDTFAEVVRSGKSVRLEYEAKVTGRTFDVFATRAGVEGGDTFALIFRDITRHREREEELRDSNLRKAFLLRLSDDLCSFGDPTCVQRTALRRLAEHLGADRVACFDMTKGGASISQDDCRGVASLTGADPVSLFGRAVSDVFGSAQPAVCPDIRTDATVSPAARSVLDKAEVRAFVGVPYFKGGSLIGGLAIHSRRPRTWTRAELFLVSEASDRFWPALEQARTESALRSSEEKFRQLADLAPSVVWTATPDGAVSYVSEQWHNFANDDAGGPAALSVHPQDRDRAVRDWAQARQDGAPFETELRILRRDGAYRWCLTRARAQRHVDGRITGWFGTTTDIDDQKRTEDTLRKGEARQGFLLSVADALRQSANPLAAQKEACRLMGDHFQVDRAFLAELDEPTGQVEITQDYFSTSLAPVAGSYRAESFGLAMSRLRQGECFTVADMHTDESLPSFVRARFLAGQIAACLCVPVIIGGRMAGAVCLASRTARAWNDTEAGLLAEVGQRIWAAVAQTRSETAQLAINTRFRTLVEGMPQLVWRAAATGRWTWASPQWTLFTGLSDDQSQGAGWLDAVHPDDLPMAEAAWVEARETGRLQCDFRLRDHVAGTYRWFQTRALPVRDAAGQLVEWLGTSTDVQDLHDMQERLRLLVAELQHRTRNLMAVVTAVTDRTLSSCDTLDVFAPLIRSRLGSIARTSGLLSKLADDGQITFDELLTSVFRGHGIEISAMPGLTVVGPEGVRLRSSSVQTLALALHELAAQALERGGLSRPEARLAVQWDVSQGDGETRLLRVHWDETFAADAVPDAEASRRFGREMIERALPYQFNAETRYELTSTGLVCQVILPLGLPRS